MRYRAVRVSPQNWVIEVQDGDRRPSSLWKRITLASAGGPEVGRVVQRPPLILGSEEEANKEIDILLGANNWIERGEVMYTAPWRGRR